MADSFALLFNCKDISFSYVNKNINIFAHFLARKCLLDDIFLCNPLKQLGVISYILVFTARLIQSFLIKNFLQYS